MEVETMPFGALLLIPVLIGLYHLTACMIAGTVLDTVSSHKPDITFEWLAIESIEVDVSLMHKQYGVWTSDPVLQAKIDLIVKEWLTVPA
jgi:hypothetical protein